MSPNKQRKSNITNTEREIIKKKRLELKNLGIPRDQWAKLIQNELTQSKKNLKKTKSKESGIQKAIKGLGNKISNVFSKFMQRKLSKSLGNMDEESMKQIMDMLSGKSTPEQNNPLMDWGMPKSSFSEEDLGKNTTFLMKDLKKKVVEVFFDEDED